MGFLSIQPDELLSIAPKKVSLMEAVARLLQKRGAEVSFSLDAPGRLAVTHQWWDEKGDSVRAWRRTVTFTELRTYAAGPDALLRHVLEEEEEHHGR